MWSNYSSRAGSCSGNNSTKHISDWERPIIIASITLVVYCLRVLLGGMVEEAAAQGLANLIVVLARSDNIQLQQHTSIRECQVTVSVLLELSSNIETSINDNVDKTQNEDF